MEEIAEEAGEMFYNFVEAFIAFPKVFLAKHFLSLLKF